MTSRRSFLKGTMGLAAAGMVQPSALAKDAYGGFRMGIQSYSLRGYNVIDALKKTQGFGLKYWESFRNHLPVTASDKETRRYKKLLSDHGVQLIAYGVQKFGADSDANRREFEFAKAMGIETISANPLPESLDNLDKLVEEYEINIAIHNHGPGALYDQIDDCMKAMLDHHERIGACVDTGHYIRSNVDPLQAIHTFKQRIYGVHLKDVKILPDGKKKFTVLGEGNLDVESCLKSLKRLRFKHCLALEYEENPKNPIADIEHCLAEVRRCAAQL